MLRLVDFLWEKLTRIPWMDRLVDEAELKLDTCDLYSEWEQHARMLDLKSGAKDWTLNDVSHEYNYHQVTRALAELKRAYEHNNTERQVKLLAGCMNRNFAGIMTPSLHSVAFSGTKILIVRFMEQIIMSMDACMKDDEYWKGSIVGKTDFFKQLQALHGNTALILSGGASLALRHLGIVKCLMENEICPRIISGASAGSIVAAYMCCLSKKEFLDMITDEEFTFYYDGRPVTGFLDHVQVMADRLERLAAGKTIFDSAALKAQIRSMIGDITFLEAFKRTNRILNISISSEAGYKAFNALNYKTSPDVVIWSAILASSALPLFFEPGMLYRKDGAGNISEWKSTPSGTWVDGSIERDVPIETLSRMFNVTQFIVSQTNPHVYSLMGPTWSPNNRARQLVQRILSVPRTLALEILPVLDRIKYCPSFFRIIYNIISQSYHGDILITPYKFMFSDITLMFDDGPGVFHRWLVRGARDIWPHFPACKQRTAIESKLSEIFYHLNCQILDQLEISTDGSSSISLSPELTQDSEQDPSNTLRSESLDFLSDQASTPIELDLDYVPFNPSKSLPKISVDYELKKKYGRRIVDVRDAIPNKSRAGLLDIVTSLPDPQSNSEGNEVKARNPFRRPSNQLARIGAPTTRVPSLPLSPHMHRIKKRSTQYI